VRVVLAGLVPALVFGASFLVPGEGSAAKAAAVGAPLLAGLGLFPLVFALKPGPAWALGVAVVLAAGGGVLVAAALRAGDADLQTAVAWVGLTFVCLTGLVSPLLVTGWRAAAAAVWLAAAGVSCGGLLLLPERLSVIPSAALTFNPLVRVLRHGLGYDWLHAANLYPRVGTIYYSYPDRTEGVLVAAGVGAAGAGIAAMIAIARRRPAAASVP
jgi:hypothetical protein